MSPPEDKKRKLGRGLSALLGEEEGSSTNLERGRAVKMVPIEFLQPGKYQPRQHMDVEGIDELSRSIAEKGVLQPLLVRPLTDTNRNNLYEIIAGERRWRASQKAKIHEVPVIIKDLNDLETLEIALIENLQRQDLSPLPITYRRKGRQQQTCYRQIQYVITQSMTLEPVPYVRMLFS